jgi:hypothetical protein
VVECGGLENRCAARHRGFESLPLRTMAPRSRGFVLHLPSPPMPSFRVRGCVAAIVLALLLPFALGCDSDSGVGLDASFFVGNWRMETVADQNGQRDRTADVRQAVNDLRATFRADGSFSLLIDFAGSLDDQSLTGTYVVSPTGQLVLTVTTPTTPVAVPFDAAARGDASAELRASAAVIQIIFAAAEVDFEFVGTVVLTLARGGAGA